MAVQRFTIRVEEKGTRVVTRNLATMGRVGITAADSITRLERSLQALRVPPLGSWVTDLAAASSALRAMSRTTSESTTSLSRLTAARIRDTAAAREQAAAAKRASNKLGEASAERRAFATSRRRNAPLADVGASHAAAFPSARGITATESSLRRLTAMNQAHARAMQFSTVQAGRFNLSLSQMSNRLRSIPAPMKRVGIALAAAFGAQQIVQLGDEVTVLRNKIAAVVKPGEDTSATFERLRQISQDTRVSLAGTTTAYSRLAVISGDLGASQKDVFQFTERLNQAVKVSGATSTEATNAIIQLTQGLGAGALRGDELRSVLEQLPTVADLIAREFNTTRGGLKKLGEAGLLSGERVFNAIKNATGITKQFARTVPTVSEQLQALRDRIGIVTESIARMAGEVLAYVNTTIDGFGSITDAWNDIPADIRAVLVGGGKKALSYAKEKGIFDGLIPVIGKLADEIERFDNTDGGKVRNDAMEKYTALMQSARGELTATELQQLKVNQLYLKITKGITDVGLGMQETEAKSAKLRADFERFSGTTSVWDFLFVKLNNGMSSTREEFDKMSASLDPQAAEYAELAEAIRVADNAIRHLGVDADVANQVVYATIEKLRKAREEASKAATKSRGPSKRDELRKEFLQLENSLYDQIAAQRELADVVKLVDKAILKLGLDADYGNQVINDFAKTIEDRLDPALIAAKKRLDDLSNISGLIPVLAAKLALDDATKRLDKSVKDGVISQELATSVLRRYKEEQKASLDPFRTMLETLREETRLLLSSNEGRERTAELLALETALRATGVQVEAEELRLLERFVDAKYRAIEAREEANKVEAAYKQVIEDVRGPQERVRIGILAINAALKDGAITTDEAAEAMKRLKGETDYALNALKDGVKATYADMETRLLDFFETGKFGWEDFAKTALREINKIMIRLAIMAAVKAAVGASGGDGAAAASGVAKLLGFAHGGQFTVPGGGGPPDSQFVPLALTKGERVTIETPQQRRRNDSPRPTQAAAPGLRPVVNVIFDPRASVDAMATPRGARVQNQHIRQYPRSTARLLS